MHFAIVEESRGLASNTTVCDTCLVLLSNASVIVDVDLLPHMSAPSFEVRRRVACTIQACLNLYGRHLMYSGHQLLSPRAFCSAGSGPGCARGWNVERALPTLLLECPGAPNVDTYCGAAIF